MTIDALEDGQLCTYCGTPVFFNGEGMTDCPSCGAEWVNGEDDSADRLDGPAVDVMEFDNDPDMIENDEFGFQCPPRLANQLCCSCRDE